MNREESNTNRFPLFEELYGCFVQVNDRFETVHIWNEELAVTNNGKYIPKLITEDEYNNEKLHSWNN